LRPAKLQKEPAIYTKRVLFIQQLRKSMVPLNEQVKKDADASVKCLVLSENQLNKLAIDEESKTAVSHKTVYENVLKQRLVALKKMGLAAWVKERKEAMALESPVKSTKEPPKPVDTGLSPHEEITFLSQLTFPQKGLDAHGYITHLPTDAELQNTLQALASADYWEVCDRCNTRFQVFPDRREEDGALTTGGKCQHHWGKKIFPRKAKNTMPGPTRYTCCNEPLGSPGCSTYDTHVFRVSDPKRLSTIMPFIETPENEEVDPHSAVCFDCEMGYTTSGLELLRLTAVSWPSHKPILDILVRPLGHILDVNTRFSGISTDQYFNAKPHDPANPIFNPTDLRIVDSPYLARDQFLKHVSPSTPLIGHALENDLNSIRLIHPLFIDTVFLYPHPAGLPIRNSLKNLAKRHLDWDIQQGGAAGHDSFEDARATGELVRFKVAQRWKMLKIDGWTIGEEGVCPPVPAGEPPPLPEVPPPSEPSTGEKRKFEQDEGIDGGEEQEPVTKKRTDASRMSF
jgi:RNA exonuclease 1